MIRLLLGALFSGKRLKHTRVHALTYLHAHTCTHTLVVMVTAQASVDCSDLAQLAPTSKGLKKMKPAINRRREETGIDFLAGTLPPEDKQVMLFCTAKQSETKEPALTLNNLKQPVAIKRKFFTSSFHPTDDGVDLRNVQEQQQQQQLYSILYRSV